ncbi:hypothetical protein K435DRAFT_849077 [Dendrothele bispora CBS 962.96]|uniref:MARVEL domain-containing protein n=1 Tax=Dendrothele bispora (strain CBS 962.96) TaxID=1314807 RepID=A0A4S8MTS2_DENBC|nr:hypothetical protein K435DRAFT_849077 [Dendrothele bispora CBS 962.96]
MPGINEKAPKSRYTSVKFWAYSIAFSLAFALAASELGLVSAELQRGGNSYAFYPSKEYKHDLGLLLFTCIAEFLFLIGHFYASVGFSAFITFVLAVFWGTGAGVLFAVSPFRATNCDNPLNSFPAAWQPYTDRCSLIVAMQGIAWALWGLHVLLLFGMLAHVFNIRTRPNVSFYKV